MLILSSEQIRQWDRYTIQKQEISSAELMERAVSRCMEWLGKHEYFNRSFVIYCGKGNNGGDGLVLARMLHARNCAVRVYILEFGHLGTDDFQLNLMRLHQSGLEIHFIQPESILQPIPAGAVIIDALFGSGLNRKPDELTSRLVAHINRSGNEVIAIDIPSGMFADISSKENEVIKAAHTLSFQCMKLAFLVPENQENLGELHLLDIGLDPAFPETLQTELEITSDLYIRAIYRPRKAFGHKGTYGHALIMAGSYGKMGAAVLCAHACLRSGAGLISCCIPACGYVIVQTALPEAMVITDSNINYLNSLPDNPGKYNVIGIGPGLGTEAGTATIVEQLLASFSKPMVIDADALNIAAANKALLNKVPPFSILTPHPKEFERLFGSTANDFEKITLALKKAKEHQVIIVLKGHYTFVAMPGGKGYFNMTGNPGMATGGSGDVLTGILTGLMATGYPPNQAALLGVYLHGLAGDFAAENLSQEAMSASDIISNLGRAFTRIKQVTKVT